MTDRLGFSHPHFKIKALAIQSASHATCGGPYCPMPNRIDKNHPPTLFLHGKRDFVVPYGTMLKYEKLLKQNGVETKKILNKKATHQWLPEAPEGIAAWFNDHLK